MLTATVFDTSIASENLGDSIIMSKVNEILQEVLDAHHLVSIPTHENIGKTSYDLIDRSEHLVVGGTNLLASNMFLDQQWEIGFRDAFHITDTILLGVGWKQYQKKPNIYTKSLLRRVLSNNYLHSVRDSYTRDKLQSIGIENVINTGCPTLWGMDKSHCQNIPQSKAENVVFTLTRYNKDKQADLKMIDILRNNYNKVFFWSQGIRDYNYLRSLTDISNIRIVDPNIQSYSHLLTSIDSIDYVGTRLHGGIHSLNHCRRTIIIGIDNRAVEMGKDFCLPVVHRDNLGELRNRILHNFEIEIELPRENICKWKGQFSGS